MTNVCNFNCDFCPIGSSTRKPGRISLDLFKKVVDEIAETGLTQRVEFHVLGEPLLHPELNSAIAYASGKGLETSLTTNGALLTEEKVQGLMDNGLDMIGISLETIDEKEHGCRRTSLDFPSYYRRVIDAIALLRNNSKVAITIHLMNPITKKLAALDHDVGIKSKSRHIKAQIARLIYDILTATGEPASKVEINNLLKKVSVNSPQEIKIDSRLKIYVQLFWDWGNAFTSRKIYPAHIGYCGYALKRIGILYDGQVTICCGDYDGKTSIGNVKERPLTELLESSLARQVKAGFEKNRVLHPYCQWCLGSTSRWKAFLKGMLSIYLFKRQGHPLEGSKKTRLSQA